jgi:hypothetical protein
MVSTEWKINKSAKFCVLCHKEFSNGEEHYSSITKEDKDFVRKDTCKNCWGKDNLEPFSYWLTKAEQKPKENLDAIVDFFNKLLLSSESDRKIENLKFILTLVLVRRKRLKLLQKVRQDNINYLDVEKIWDGQIARIKDLELNEQDLGELKLELEKLFDVNPALPLL